MDKYLCLIIIGCALAILTDCQECGKSSEFDQISNRIAGGESTTYGEIPWQVGLFENGIRRCGGTIVHPKWVLTATHCVISSFYNENFKKEYSVMAGDHSAMNLDEFEQERFIVRLEIHPDFNTITLVNDIALLEVDRPFEYNDYVVPACLPNPDESPYPFTECTVSGWGFDTPFTKPDISKKIHIPIFPHKMCEVINRPGLTSSIYVSTMTCAGDLIGGKGPCKGDSGGPLTCPRADGGAEVVTGVVSWGSGCGVKGEAAVYTRVESFIGWIAETLAIAATTNDDPCKYSGVKSRDERGGMKSPGYEQGENYPRSVRCSWDVEMPLADVTSSSTLVISFGSFDVEASPDDLCRYDYVEIYTGDNYQNLLDRYCGETAPSDVVLPLQEFGLKFRMVFRSDNTVPKTGFQATYRFFK